MQCKQDEFSQIKRFIIKNNYKYKRQNKNAFHSTKTKSKIFKNKTIKYKLQNKYSFNKNKNINKIQGHKKN